MSLSSSTRLCWNCCAQQVPSRAVQTVDGCGPSNGRPPPNASTAWDGPFWAQQVQQSLVAGHIDIPVCSRLRVMAQGVPPDPCTVRCPGCPTTCEHPRGPLPAAQDPAQLAALRSLGAAGAVQQLIGEGTELGRLLQRAPALVSPVASLRAYCRTGTAGIWGGFCVGCMAGFPARLGAGGSRPAPWQVACRASLLTEPAPPCPPHLPCLLPGRSSLKGRLC